MKFNPIERYFYFLAKGESCPVCSIKFTQSFSNPNSRACYKCKYEIINFQITRISGEDWESAFLANRKIKRIFGVPQICDNILHDFANGNVPHLNFGENQISYEDIGCGCCSDTQIVKLNTKLVDVLITLRIEKLQDEISKLQEILEKLEVAND